MPPTDLVEARTMRLPRLRPSLSLRMLLLLILVAGLWLGWRVDRARRQRLAIAQVEKYNGYIKFDDEPTDGRGGPEARPRGPAWLRRFLGDEYFREARRVIYVDQPISDAILAPLADLDGIEELAFLSQMHHVLAPVDPPPGLDRLTESGLRRLEGLTRLRRLEIERKQLGGSMLRHLRRSARLEELDIFEDDGIESGITDEGMPDLGTMPRLRRLSPWCDRITGSCLRPLRGSRSLEDLEFYGSPLSEAGFENIGAIASLKGLRLTNVDAGDDSLWHLRNLKGLTRLDLDRPRSRITDAGLAHLGGMTRLEVLDLTGCRITGRGLASLKGLKQLRTLGLGWTQVDDDGLEVIAGFPRLEILALHQTKVTDAGLAHLKGLKHLRSLSVEHTAVTPPAVDALKAAIPTLTDAP